MDSARIKKIILTILTGIIVYYIVVTGVNLALRLTTAIQPNCNPLYCQEIKPDSSGCLIKTPGFSECVGVEGSFYILSSTLSYILLGLSLIFAFYLSQRFFISRFLIFFSIIALVVVGIRTLLGSIDLSVSGLQVELNKTGLNHPFFKIFGATLFEMFNPKF